MTLQQMEYIVAVDRYRHFIKAAEACGVTQSTLSTLIQKLEQELDIQIFDRKAHPIAPTPMGEKVIAQAKVLLYNASQLQEMVHSERATEEGILNVGIISTVAPYILPKMVKKMPESFRKIKLHVLEARINTLVQKLEMAELDMVLISNAPQSENLLEIPIYKEPFVAYLSPDEEIYSQEEITLKKLPMDHIWVLREDMCFGKQVLNVCGMRPGNAAIYEAGSIDTLVRIVDENGGFTIIPEFHLNLLREEQKRNVRKFVTPEPMREVSLLIRKDYVKERMLNIVAQMVQEIVPEEYIDPRIKKFGIRI